MLAKKIGIDLGTSTVLIYVRGEGIVVNEPSLVAVNRDGSRILAVGRQAFEMVVSGQVEKAFNLNEEPDSVREAYGRESIGEKGLLARVVMCCREEAPSPG